MKEKEVAKREEWGKERNFGKKLGRGKGVEGVPLDNSQRVSQTGEPLSYNDMIW